MTVQYKLIIVCPSINACVSVSVRVCVHMFVHVSACSACTARVSCFRLVRPRSRSGYWLGGKGGKTPGSVLGRSGGNEISDPL